MALLSASFAGFMFALGLGLAGMTDPSKVVGFLDVAGKWDPTLAFVMGGALVVHGVSRRFISRRKTPLLAPAFPTAHLRRLDAPLWVGSALFGVGWGLSGYCPGPALTSLASGASEVLLFVTSMMGGMGFFALWQPSRAIQTPEAVSTSSLP